MRVFPSEEEIELAADLLVHRYDITAGLLGQLLGNNQKSQAGVILQELGVERPDRMDLARYLIYQKGSSLFSGSYDSVRELRKKLLQRLPEGVLKDLFEKYGGNNNIKTTSYMVSPLVKRKWINGRGWAADFVTALGFPPVFAGVRSEQTRTESFIDVEPFTRVPELVPFQRKLKDKMLEVLNQEGDRTRCIVTLPTGGGKTRVAVEAFIDWMQPRFSEGKCLIWVAQSEELCEQAVKCIQDIWSIREFIHPLRVYRYFGSHDFSVEDLQGGVIVASIQKLHYRIQSENETLLAFLKDTGAMIIDEAHRAVSVMYDGLLEKAEQLCGPSLFPICGLTATPGRADASTSRLVSRFEAYLIEPEMGEEYRGNPMSYFREHGYLARAKHIQATLGKDYTITEEEMEAFQPGEDEQVPRAFLKRLAEDKDRNVVILKRLLEIPGHKPTLVYACTVEHAEFLAAILNAKGRRAAVISAKTPLSVRRGLIHDFKTGRIEFLCNYGVLTTGFDAPCTEVIAICRPTTSVILYEQIIGRGLRGPKFGGTEECEIIDFTDNIYYLGKPLTYARFSKKWQDFFQNSEAYMEGHIL